jgi:hypothetical protein
MEKQKNVSVGVKWGIIIGLLYIAFIFLRYNQGVKNPILFVAFAAIGFISVLILLFVTGLQRRKLSGGYIDLKDIFQTLFITVLVLELFYTLFNFIYLKAIDPDFFQKFKDASERMALEQGMSQKKIDEQLDKVDVNTASKLSAGTIIIQYLYNVAVTGVFAMIIGLIIRRKRPPFQNDQATFQTTEN